MSNMTFESYLVAAFDRCLQDENHSTDDGNLALTNKLCRAGVLQNWEQLTACRFVAEFAWCVGSVQKPWERHVRFFPLQEKLFRYFHPNTIVAEERLIRREWKSNKCDLNLKMVKAVIGVAQEIVASGWDSFKEQRLLLPNDPDTLDPDDWKLPLKELMDFPQVGPALSLFMLRTFYGAPFFKPDIHIIAIANHFFGNHRQPIMAMTDAVRQLWPKVCTKSRFLPVHIGEVDYILWWYRRSTGKPE